MKHLVTGASGFLGTHLCEHLAREFPKDTVYTLGRKARPKAKHHRVCDLADTDKLGAIFEEIQPDRIYHLAGNSKVGEQTLPQHFAENFLTSISLLEALDKVKGTVGVFLASSVHVYGSQPDKLGESSPVKPETAYGFSKYLMEEAARKTSVSAPKRRIVIGRLYSCIGPGQREGFVIADLCRRIRALPAKGGVLKTGDLSALRSFMDARDVVQLLPRLLEQKSKSSLEIYNLTSPRYHTIGEVVETLLKLSGKQAKVQPDPKIAPNSFKGLRLDNSKLEAAVRPKFRPLEETLRDTLESV